MKPKLTFALTALVLTLAIGVTAAFAGTTRSSADPGVTSTSILLGTTSPLSGVASAYASVARGADAYFKYVNARGGVNGRKINFISYDDAYMPPKTVEMVRKLVEQDGVLALEAVARMQDPVRPVAVIRDDHQALGIGVEATGRPQPHVRRGLDQAHH